MKICSCQTIANYPHMAFCNANKLHQNDLLMKTKCIMIDYNRYNSIANPHMASIYSKVEVISSQRWQALLFDIFCNFGEMLTKMKICISGDSWGIYIVYMDVFNLLKNHEKCLYIKQTYSSAKIKVCACYHLICT